MLETLESPTQGSQSILCQGIDIYMTVPTVLWDFWG